MLACSFYIGMEILMNYTILIVDDEPLVQVGLRSMLSKGFENLEIVGAAGNGRDALSLIDEKHPVIVIADIKMPIMTGLELIRASREKFGELPVFIMLTAYEEFDMAREALSLQAVDYLVKIDLNQDALHQSIDKAIRRVDQLKPNEAPSAQKSANLELFQQKFMLRLLNHMFKDEETLSEAARDVSMQFTENRYIVVVADIASSSPHVEGSIVHEENSVKASLSQEKRLTLYNSCLDMSKEILAKYFPFYIVSNDPSHFTIIAAFSEDTPIAEISDRIQDAILNTRDMILNYFNISVYFGIGTAVSHPMDIAASFDEAKTAMEAADDHQPIRLFSHIVGANRRSGKDKLIASIQQYIDENLDGHMQLNEIAEKFGLSPAYLSVLFKKNMEIGFSEYVYTKKIEKAKEMLLSDDMKIYEVADALGFESAYYFSKVFKRVTGESPREFIQSKTGAQG